MATKEQHKEQWDRIFRSITDPEEIQKNKRLAQKKQRSEAKKRDTGL